ncbi:hypothetical protein O9K63_11835 [Janibacter cremeus]|nr:hypothetical protein [Janibacter cremeus]WEV77279.1 hypothetical protein O9K63_11835 [Janibacter cremeus]
MARRSAGGAPAGGRRRRAGVGGGVGANREIERGARSVLRGLRRKRMR